MPIYVYQCYFCKAETEEFHGIRESPSIVCPDGCRAVCRRIPARTTTTMKEYRKPIAMHSIGLCDAEGVADFQHRNPDVPISTNPRDELYGVPIARSLHEKKAILKKEGYVDKNSY